MQLSPVRLAARRAGSPAGAAATTAIVGKTSPTPKPRVQQQAKPTAPSPSAATTSTISSASLAGSHPHLAALWTVNVKAGSNSLTRAHNVDASSTKLIHWTCGSCSHVYARRVRDQVAVDGACPSCSVLAADAPVPEVDTSVETVGTGARAVDGDKKKSNRGRKMKNVESKPKRNAADSKKRSLAQLQALLSKTSIAAATNAAEASTSAVGSNDATSTSTNDDDAPTAISSIQQALHSSPAEYSGAQSDALAAGKVIDPMLAQSWDTWSHLIPQKEELLISPKLDGIRCIIGWDSVAQAPVFLSRKGKVFESADHLVPYLKPLFEDDPTLVLDGELYNHHILALDFELLAGAVRTTRAKRSAEVEALQGSLQYHVFDVMHSKSLTKLKPKFADPTSTKKQQRLSPDDQAAQSMLHYGNGQGVTPGKVCEGSGYHVPFTSRYELLKNRIMPNLIRHAAKINKKMQIAPGTKPPIVLVPHVPSFKQNMTRELEKALSKNYEGVMIRRKGAGYAFGKRSPFLLKFKKMQDSEYEVVGMVPGKGKWTGSLGAMLCKTKNGHRFTVSPSVTEKMRRRMWARRTDYVGKMLTVQYQGIGSGGVPRFPIGKCIRGQVDGSDWV